MVRRIEKNFINAVKESEAQMEAEEGQSGNVDMHASGRHKGRKREGDMYPENPGRLASIKEVQEAESKASLIISKASEERGRAVAAAEAKAREIIRSAEEKAKAEYDAIIHKAEAGLVKERERILKDAHSSAGMLMKRRLPAAKAILLAKELAKDVVR